MTYLNTKISMSGRYCNIAYSLNKKKVSTCRQIFTLHESETTQTIWLGYLDWEITIITEFETVMPTIKVCHSISLISQLLKKIKYTCAFKAHASVESIIHYNYVEPWRLQLIHKNESGNERNPLEHDAWVVL